MCTNTMGNLLVYIYDSIGIESVFEQIKADNKFSCEDNDFDVQNHKAV